MKEFGNNDPVTLVMFFLAVILVAMFVWNPILQAAALIGGLAFCAVLQSRKETLKDFVMYTAIFLLISITNPLFSHNGETSLFFIGSIPITFESLANGAGVAVMIISVIAWFKCYSKVMTSDKTLYLFGRSLPKLSLVMSMSMRFIPMLTRQMHKVSRTQRAMGLYASGGIKVKIQASLRVLSALITWSLENSVETSSSMKARGYGLQNRSSFSLFRFTTRDFILLISSVSLLGITLLGVSTGSVNFSFYPTISEISFTTPSVITYLAYFTLAFLPFAVEIKENLKWKYFASKT